MLILIVSLVLLAIFLLVGLLTWGIVRIAGKRRKGRRVLLWTFLAWLVFLPLFFFGISPLWIAGLMATSSGTRPFDLDLTDDPSTYGCSFEAVEFTSRDGRTLHGWWMDGDERPPIVFGHGLFRNRHEVVERACDWNQLGFATFVFDFRGHSIRSGQKAEGPITLGYKERLDVLGAAEFLRGRGRPRAVLGGVSMGAVAAIEAAADEPDSAAAIIADSPYDSLEGTVRHHTRIFMGLPAFPFADIFIWRLTRIGGFNGDDLNTADALAKLPNTPLLLIYGADDERMPRTTAEALYAASPCPVKDLLFVEGARHGAAYRRARERYNATVAQFLERALNAASSADPQ